VKETEIAALITLLDDDDREVVAHVWNKIKSIGPSIVPILENSWNPDFNPTQSERLEDLIHEIQFDKLLLDFDEWLKSPTQDLLRGYFLISQYFYPEIDFNAVESKILKLRQKIWIELNYNQTPFEQIQFFNQVLYRQIGFKGDAEAAENHDFCLNHILETKRANPISLGLLYIILAQSLQLPIFGVRLQGYFILAFCKSNHLDFSNENQLLNDVLFYLNPFQNGVIFSKAQIDDYIKRVGIKAEMRNYIPADTRNVLRELLTYIIHVNKHNSKTPNHRAIEELNIIRRKIE
jgi:regulator of sirC expression with transglutaminase-like and TPR domain